MISKQFQGAPVVGKVIPWSYNNKHSLHVAVTKGSGTINFEYGFGNLQGKYPVKSTGSVSHTEVDGISTTADLCYEFGALTITSVTGASTDLEFAVVIGWNDLPKD